MLKGRLKPLGTAAERLVNDLGSLYPEDYETGHGNSRSGRTASWLPLRAGLISKLRAAWR
jgi:hypothetical protein